MWIRGHKRGVGFWYVLWGLIGASYNMEVYQTFNGLANWFRKEAYRDIPVHRIGRMVVTEEGFQEKEYWTSREEFIEFARHLVPFQLPKAGRRNKSMEEAKLARTNQATVQPRRARAPKGTETRRRSQISGGSRRSEASQFILGHRNSKASQNAGGNRQ